MEGIGGIIPGKIHETDNWSVSLLNLLLFGRPIQHLLQGLVKLRGAALPAELLHQLLAQLQLHPGATSLHLLTHAVHDVEEPSEEDAAQGHPQGAQDHARGTRPCGPARLHCPPPSEYAQEQRHQPRSDPHQLGEAHWDNGQNQGQDSYGDTEGCQDEAPKGW